MHQPPQQPGRRGFDCALVCEMERANDGEDAPHENRWKEKADAVGLVVGIWNRLEEDIEVAKPMVEIVVNGHGISGLVDVGSSDHVDNSVVKHVEDR
ncbi:hypothetical protein CHGG_07116 [Chaetomium globosum CBS 148.51]|uniref:Uncharacterized protein n=1 Tax=Chaetomium globosum (strain ATCC 6205 / CBS 148.51 / DSM 1962 / NBRC 6347 / NRRL 1970) TaxID=306901 RepID=Q2GY38_CHAGB|nr:uncharacterized protein CHGG_07116 [Chaetomium globosum CBS 148.51]EAQ85863.1 hypothetical protein CHGG_07116 [Chaetomium globosum CBS 148.51]